MFIRIEKNDSIAKNWLKIFIFSVKNTKKKYIDNEKWSEEKNCVWKRVKKNAAIASLTPSILNKNIAKKIFQ